MARFAKPSPDLVSAWEAWVATCPRTVRDVIAEHRLDPWTLYRLTTTDQRVSLISVSESGTVRVAVTGEFNLVTHERAVFGINPADLKECDLPNDDELLGSMELSVEEVRQLAAGETPPRARTTLLPKIYPRQWPRKVT